MRNVKKFGLFLTGATIMVAMALSVNSAFATCPTTSCSSDCGKGEICSITQYDENGVVCSWTICYGVGPDWGNEQ